MNNAHLRPCAHCGNAVAEHRVDIAEDAPHVIESITCSCGLTVTAPIVPGVTLAGVWNRRVTDSLLRDAAGIIASTLRMFQRAKIDSSAEKAILDRIAKQLWEAS